MDRQLQQLWEACYILGGITFGFPIAVIIFRYLMIERCCKKVFATTGGVTCFEIFAKSLYCFFCCKKFS
jgi:hypothetical protein